MNDLVRHANRRAFLAACAGIGVTSNFFAGALYALASQNGQPSENPTFKIDDTMIDEAAFLAGVSITPGQKHDMLIALNQQLRGIKNVRKLNLPNNVPLNFNEARIERADIEGSKSNVTMSALLPCSVFKRGARTQGEKGTEPKPPKFTQISTLVIGKD